MVADPSGRFTEEQMKYMAAMAATLGMGFRLVYDSILSLVGAFENLTEAIVRVQAKLDEFYRRELLLKEMVMAYWPHKWAVWVATHAPVWMLPEPNMERLVLLTRALGERTGDYD